MPKGFKNMKAKAKAKAVNFAAKKIYGADVIEAVAEDCLSAGFMDMLKEWMDAHQDEFSAGVSPDTEGMYPPQYMESYKLFKAFSDAQIEGFVKKHKKTVEQFMEMCAKASNAAPQVQAFIDILTASSEFQVFVDMMTNRERRDYFFFVMKSWRMEMQRAQQFQKSSQSKGGGGAQPAAAEQQPSDQLGMPPSGEGPAPSAAAAAEPEPAGGDEIAAEPEPEPE